MKFDNNNLYNHDLYKIKNQSITYTLKLGFTLYFNPDIFPSAVAAVYSCIVRSHLKMDMESVSSFNTKD